MVTLRQNIDHLVSFVLLLHQRFPPTYSIEKTMLKNEDFFIFTVELRGETPDILSFAWKFGGFEEFKIKFKTIGKYVIFNLDEGQKFKNNRGIQ